MKRRQFIIGAAGTALLVGSGGWLAVASSDAPLTLDAVSQKLATLKAEAPTMLGAWGLSQVLVHCAQSVEYSMTGFPEHKSALFKQTAGRMAFAVFSSKGKMSHGLDEAIPGAPALDSALPLADAFARVEKAVADFAQHTGPMQPHFAYGKLSKEQYEAAHAMHFYNHFLELAPAA